LPYRVLQALEKQLLGMSPQLEEELKAKIPETIREVQKELYEEYKNLNPPSKAIAESEQNSNGESGVPPALQGPPTLLEADIGGFNEFVPENCDELEWLLN
jgi:hypothetical protein